MPAIRLSTSSRAISVVPASTGSRSPCADTVSLAGFVPATPAAPTRMRLPLAPSRQPSIRPNSRIHAAAVIGGTSVHVAAGNHGTPGRRAQLEKHQRALAFSGACADRLCPHGRSSPRCALTEDVGWRRATLGSTPALDRGPPVAHPGITRSRQWLLAGSTIRPIGPGQSLLATSQIRPGDASSWPMLLKNSKMHLLHFLAKLNRDRQFDL